MKKLFLLTFIFWGCSVLTPLQKSKLLTVSNLIDASKFGEAKIVVEEMIADRESASWARTWYLRGVLCQTAYQEGVKKNDRNLFELYPNQLYVAHESFEKALSLDKGGRLERQLAPKYVLLANDFQKIGDNDFRAKRFNDALKAFETALKITQSPIISIETDMNLIYNAAVSAYESGDWDKAINHLNKLHRNKFSVNSTHLLFNAKLEKGDTLTAIRIMNEGIARYSNNEDLVLLLTDLHYNRKNINEALKTLDEVISKNPTNYRFLFTKGLVYQKSAKYSDAIDVYSKAHSLEPNDPMVHINIATCYYNIGVEIDVNTRSISNSRIVMEEKAKSTAAFDSAIMWLDRIVEKGVNDPVAISKISDLYRALRASDKANSIGNQLK
jgi:tetratricopeptide (TPR) repeat protein